jgi:hypothetical protein
MSLWGQPGIHLRCGRDECRAIDDCAYREPDGRPCWAAGHAFLRAGGGEAPTRSVGVVEGAAPLTIANEPRPLFDEYIGFGHEE